MAANSATSSRAHRLILPTNIPPPPIPPRLLSRVSEHRKSSPHPSTDPGPKWIDKDEFAVASQARKPKTQAASAATGQSAPLPYGPHTFPNHLSASHPASYPSSENPYPDSRFPSRGGWPTHQSTSTSKSKTTS
ncbi:hypothetical protein K439DRAFT_1625788 [Ramaria rubella]|nr:hypothetical protein K439DRAFT_1625788 [Ramaria rubella]